MTIDDLDLTLPMGANPARLRVDDAIDRLAHLPVTVRPFAEVLHEIAALALVALPGTESAVTFVTPADRPTTVDAQVGMSTTRVESLARAEVDIGRGPATDAWASDTVIRSDDVRHESRWPRWSRRAASVGLRSVLAAALPGHEDARVTMLWVCDGAGRFDPDDEDAARRFASVAGGAVRSARVAAELRGVRDNLALALHSRASIDQAIGIIVARSGATPEDAWQRLRALSQREHVKVAELARRTVEQAVRPGRPGVGRGSRAG